MKTSTISLLTALLWGASSIHAATTESWGVSLDRFDTTVNTWDRNAVIQLFRDEYVANHWLPITNTGADWTGGTTPGTMDEGVEHALMDKVNCLRHLTGTPLLTELSEDSYEATYSETEGWTNRYHADCARWAAFVEAALWYDTGTIKHYPSSDVRWYNEDAAYGASHSLLAIGTGYPTTDGAWPDPIQQWCWEGSVNTGAGHMLAITGGYAELDGAYIATCPFDEDALTGASATPKGANRLSSAMIYTRDADMPYDFDTAYQYAYPCEGYFPKGFLPVYWAFIPYGMTYVADDTATVTIKKNGVELEGVTASVQGSIIIFSVPELSTAIDDDYFTATDGLRQSVLKDDLGEAGDVTYEVSISLRVSSDPSGYGESDYEEKTYTYTVVAFDWPEGSLTYQVFPDEYQVGYGWKYTSWLGYYYTYGDGWIYSYDLDNWLYVFDAGNFGPGGEVYTSETANGKIKWDVPTLAETDYDFWAWDASRETWMYINPKWFPWAYASASDNWVKLK